MSWLPRHPKVEPVAVAARIGVRTQVHIKVVVGGLNDLLEVAGLELGIEPELARMVVLAVL